MADRSKSSPEQKETTDTDDDGVIVTAGQTAIVPMATATPCNSHCSQTVINFGEMSNQVIQKSSNVQNVQMTFNFDHAENMVFGEGGSIINAGDRKGLDLSKQSCLIDQTKAWVLDQRERQPYVPTKAISVAKEKILKNKCLIIRGNSGDGKTRLAVELLHWLMNEHDMDIGQTGETSCPKKEPISLTDLMTWDNTISPNSHLAILFDDLFGYGSEIQKEINWWKKRESFIRPCLQGAGNDRANCLIITVRNDIYYEHKSMFDGQVLFTQDNVIDLSSTEFSLEDEKKSILKMYTTTLGNFQQFSEREIAEILRTSPGIGFPECCRVFASTSELQHKRVNFFKHPLKYMRDVIKGKFHEEQQKALLYLFLSHGHVPAKQLDLENESIDQITVEKVFNMSMSEKIQESLNGDLGSKLRCIKKGLESLCGSFVRKEKGVYHFFHDSTQDAVAILYGELTPQGFLKYCNSECLRYIATPKCKETSCKIVVDEGIYEYVYQRIFEELKLGDGAKLSVIASLIPWSDGQFLSGFFEWIDEQVAVPEDFRFRPKTGNEMSDDCDGVFDQEMNEDEQSCFFVVVAKVNSYCLLKRLIDRSFASAGQLKKALDQAISSGSEECVSLLLEAGVIPDSSSCFSAVEGGKTDLLHKLDRYDIIPTSRAEMSRSGYQLEDVNVFHEACLFQHQEMVNFLLEKYPSLLQEDGRYGYSSLHFIARTGNLSLYQQVEPLVLEGYTGTDQHYIESLLDVDGKTLLHAACASGSLGLCEHLCIRYTSLVSNTDKFGRHSLHFAAMSGNLDCFKYIAALTLREKTQEECQCFMAALVDVRYQRTVLHWACESGCKELCIFVCQEYPSLLSQRDRNRLHCLHFAAVTCDQACFEALAKFVLKDKNGSEIRHFMDSLITNDQRTVLHVACQSGNQDLAMYLCKTYPSLLSLRDKRGRHSLHYTVEPGNLEFYRSIESLVLAGKTYSERQLFMEEVTSQFNGTILVRACWFGSKAICMYLCEKYPSLLSIRDNFGMHCIHYAAMSWNLDCYKAIEALVIREESAKGNKNYMESLLTDRGVSVVDLVSGEVEVYKKALHDYVMSSARPTSSSNRSSSSRSSPSSVRTRRFSSPINSSSQH
ncbi:uncharacterized protein LOC110457731 [Mizuhopecten yessoensis]|uniref:uncharacterized protein LOC110457731 n=1 Tax=Mizuhopecten yessoensis TaxID=6573 RepID=UPI000B45948E|nr:uncharacterized protein LOC110457731 [Mizuhopecten yessoensis]XP_021364792.1 uncharacterized protein LOC110457731 [Mizuhopecten yessoensis]